MAAATSFPFHIPSSHEEQRVLLSNVPWSAYVVLRDSVDSSGVRMTYMDGVLEIMSPSHAHEVYKTQIARFLVLFCWERNIPLVAYGSKTFRKEKHKKDRGLEPDECYCRGADRDVPDVALEVVVTRGAIDKLEIYRELGVREVWIFESGAFRVLALKDAMYKEIASSEVFPEIDLPRIAHYALEPDQLAAVEAFRDEMRKP